MIEQSIDYLQFTANMQEHEFRPDEVKTIGGLPYYPRGYLAHNGVRYYFGNNKGMNCFVVLAGQQCQYLRDCGQSDKQLLEWAYANGAKISRLDLAVTEWNTFDGMFEIKDVASWFADGLITSALCEYGCKEVSEVTKSGHDMQSVYIGDLKKRGKRGIFRAYDKGVELDIGLYAAHRLEIELKRDKANSAARRIVDTGDIAGNFRTYFDVKHPTFERLMNAPKFEAKRGKGKIKDMRENENDKRWEWLLNQVAPAMREAIAIDEKTGVGNERMFQFMAKSGILNSANDFANKLAEFKLSQIKIEKYNLLD